MTLVGAKAAVGAAVKTQWGEIKSSSAVVRGSTTEDNSGGRSGGSTAVRAAVGAAAVGAVGAAVGAAAVAQW